MDTWAFFKRRLIRLHPLVIFGTLFGALMFYFGSCSVFPLISQTPWYMVLLVMLWCFTMIPLPNTMDIRGWAETNPLNGPDKDAPLGQHIFVAVSIFVLAIFVAYGTYRLYDLPVREWLKKKLFRVDK